MAMSVSFGETPAFDIVVLDENTLTCTVPAAEELGTVDVIVASDTYQSSDVLEGAYTYALIPEIVSVNPDTAPAGQATFYTVNGNNLPAEGDPQAWFAALEPDGDPIALDVTYSNGFPTFSLTAETEGTYDLWVEDGSGTELARLDAAVEIIAPPEPPTLTAVDPTTKEEGPAAWSLYMTGTGLLQLKSGTGAWGAYRVRIFDDDGVSQPMAGAPASDDTDTYARVAVAAALPGGPFTVEIYDYATGEAVSSLPDAITVTPMANPPVLTAIEPTSGPIGTAVTLTGTSLPTDSRWRAGLVDDDGDLRMATSVSRGTTQWTGSVGGGDYTDGVAYDVIMWWSYNPAVDASIEATLPAAFTVIEVVQQVEPSTVPPATTVTVTATGEGLDQYTDWLARLDVDEGEVGDPRTDVPVGGFDVLSETQVQFSVTLPVQGAYHIVALDPAGSTVVLGFDKVTADPSAEVTE